MAAGVRLLLTLAALTQGPHGAAEAAAGGGAQVACAGGHPAGRSSALLQQSQLTVEHSISLAEKDEEEALSRKVAGNAGAVADFTANQAEAVVVALAEKVATQNYTMTPLEEQAMKTIKDMIGKLFKSAEQQRDAGQFQVDEAKDILRNCSVTANASLARAAAYKRMAREHRKRHSECRTAEWNHTRELCAKYDIMRKTDLKTPPSCMSEHLTERFISTDDPVMKAEMEQCLEETNVWFQALYGHYAACKEERSNTTSECDAEQGVFEQSYCSYTDALSSTCAAQDTCRFNALEHLERTESKVKAAQASWMADYMSGKHVMCYFSVFTANATEKTSILKDCQDANHSLEDLKIRYSDLANLSAVPCTLEAHQPCDTAWEAAEYTSQPWYEHAPTAECRACPELAPAIPEAPGGGSTASLTPAPTTRKLSAPEGFHVRCAYADSVSGGHWQVVLDYSDDRSTDDIPNSAQAIQAGFTNSSAFYIGEAALNELNFTEARVCIKSSAHSCQEHCTDFHGEHYEDCEGCPGAVGGLGSKVKKIVGLFAGQCIGLCPHWSDYLQKQRFDMHWSGRTFISSTRDGWAVSGHRFRARFRPDPAWKKRSNAYEYELGHSGGASHGWDPDTIQIFVK